MTEKQIDDLSAKLKATLEEVHKHVVGQEKVLKEIMITFFAGGHALLEGVPGLAKTLMVKSIAHATDLAFNRVQFTPDLMPSDILGTEVLEEDKESGKKFFKFIQGPVFTQILLADEINRTPPKTQAALLQAMQELEVSYAGQHYPLARPFMILATQNPIEQSGTYPLPEAQLDRFLMYINVPYPDENEEFEILKQTTSTSQSSIKSVLSADDIMQIRALVREIIINDDLIQWVGRLVRNSRPQRSTVDAVSKYVRWGAGPRAGQAIILCAKAHAFMQSRLAVVEDDINTVIHSVMRHRILLNYQAEAEKIDTDYLVDELIRQTPIAK